MSFFSVFKKLIVAPVRTVMSKVYCYYVRHNAMEVKGKLVVNRWSKVSKQTILGSNVNFNGFRIIGWGKVEIGDNFHSAPECLFITSYHNYDHGERIPYDDTYIHKDIKIEDNVWLGSRVVVLGGVTIGEGAIIQAGSVVVTDIPKYGIAGGSPAKVFKMRDIDHYLELKEAGQYH